MTCSLMKTKHTPKTEERNIDKTPSNTHKKCGFFFHYFAMSSISHFGRLLDRAVHIQRLHIRKQTQHSSRTADCFNIYYKF